MNSTTYNGLTSVYGAEIKSIAPNTQFADGTVGVGSDDNYIYSGGTNITVRKYNKKTLLKVAESASTISDILTKFTIYNGYLYAGSAWDQSWKIRKINTTDLSTISSVGGLCFNGFKHIVDNVIYGLRVDNYSMGIKAYDADTLESIFTLNSTPYVVNDFSVDGDYIYMSGRSVYDGAGVLQKYNRHTLALITSISIGTNSFVCRAVLVINGYLYTAGDTIGSTTNNALRKYDLNLNLINSTNLVAGTSITNLSISFLSTDSDGYIYACGMYGIPAIFKYNSDLTRIAYNTGYTISHGTFNDMVVDEGFLWTSGGSQAAKKLSKTTLSTITTTPRFNVINTTPFNIVSGGSIPLSGASLEMDYYRITAPSALITLVHPNSGTSAYDYGYLLEADYDCIEIWSAYSGLSAEAEWDYVLNNKSDLVYGIVSDGGYNVNDTATFNKGYIEIEEESTNEALLNNIKTGKFYAVKNGHYLRVNQTSNVLTAISNTDSNFEFISDISTTTVSNTKKAIHNILGFEKYIRVKCIDVADPTKVAWSQPIPINWS
jgi:hypothetical protein